MSELAEESLTKHKILRCIKVSSADLRRAALIKLVLMKFTNALVDRLSVECPVEHVHPKLWKWHTKVIF